MCVMNLRLLILRLIYCYLLNYYRGDKEQEIVDVSYGLF